MADKVLGFLTAYLGFDTTEFQKNLTKAQKQFKAVGRDMEQSGLRMSALIGAPLTAIGVNATKSFLEFESAFAGVKKTVDASPEGFKKLEAEIRNLAKTMPTTAVELSKIAENAGQLGVGAKDIVEFTRVMAMIGETTNLSADTAATALAQFANIVDFPLGQIEKLGASVVALGNDGASTEQEIVLLGQRLAAAGDMAGLSAQEIFGLASSLANVGIEAEAGGSSISRVLKDMNTAVISGGDNLKEFSRIAGTDFRKAFKEDASDAFTSFIGGLQRIRESGGDVQSTLEDLGFGELKVSDALGRLSKSSEAVGKAFAISNSEFDRGKALVEEYNKRLVTTESQLQISKNILNDVGITIGSKLAPQWLGLNQILGSAVDVFNTLSPSMQNFLVYLGEGLVLVTTGTLAFGALATILGTVSLGFVGVSVAVVSAIAGFVAFRNDISTIFTDVSTIVVNFINIGLKGSFNAGLQFIVDWMNKFGSYFHSLDEKYLNPFIQKLNSVFGTSIPINTKAFEPFEAKLISLNEDITHFKTGATSLFGTVSNATVKAGDAIGSFGKAVSKVMGADAPAAIGKTGKATKEMKDEIEKAKKAFKDLGDSLKDAISKEDLKFLEDNLAGAFETGNEALAENLKQELKKKITEGMIEGYKAGGGKIDAESTAIIGQKAQLELENKISSAYEKGSKVGLDKGTKDSPFPNYLSEMISSSLISGFEEGFNSDTIKKGAASLASIFTQKFQDSFAKIFSSDKGGGFNLANVTDSLSNLAIAYGVSSLGQNLSDNKKDTKGGIISGGIAGAGIGAQLGGPYGALIGAVVGAGAGYLAGTLGPSTNSDTVNRHDTATYIENLLKDKGGSLSFLQDGYNIQEGYNTRFNTQNLDNPWYRAGLNPLQQLNPIYQTTTPLLNDIQHQQDTMFVGEMANTNPSAGPGSIGGPDWATQYWNQFGQQGGESFNALGAAFSQMAGTMGPQMEQIGVILAENLGGNLDNARMLLDVIGISARDLEQSFMQIGLSGEESWHTVEVYMQRIPELTGEGLVAFGDLMGAMEAFRNSSGRGKEALVGLKNILAEATDLGIKNFSELREHMIAQGVSIEDADRLFQSFAQRGINSMDDLKNASDRNLGGVVADMESLGFAWTPVSDGIDSTTQSVDKLDQKLKSLQKEVDLTVNVKYDEKNQPPDAVGDTMSKVFTSSGISKLQKYTPSNSNTSTSRMFKGTGGLMDSMGSGSQVVYNIDARGAQAGVEVAILEAMKVVHKQAVQDSISTMIEMKRRGVNL